MKTAEAIQAVPEEVFLAPATVPAQLYRGKKVHVGRLEAEYPGDLLALQGGQVCGQTGGRVSRRRVLTSVARPGR